MPEVADHPFHASLFLPAGHRARLGSELIMARELEDARVKANVVADALEDDAFAWWQELPPAGRDAWAERAGRRKQRKTYRLGFINTKTRDEEEPEPFIYEVDV